MAAARQEFEIGGALLGLYKDLPYVTKLGYSAGEMGERIVVRAIIDADGGYDEFFGNSMASVRKAREFRDMLPASAEEKYEVVPIVTDSYGGALRHFGTMRAVIDR